jgi:hypothetical protein
MDTCDLKREDGSLNSHALAGGGVRTHSPAIQRIERSPILIPITPRGSAFRKPAFGTLKQVTRTCAATLKPLSAYSSTRNRLSRTIGIWAAGAQRR